LPLPTNTPEFLKNGKQIMRVRVGEAMVDIDEIDKGRDTVLKENLMETI
jgi:hypothetical protein